jgi:hypothetical protein
VEPRERVADEEAAVAGVEVVGLVAEEEEAEVGVGEEEVGVAGRKSRERRGDDAVRGWKVGAVVGGCLYGFGTLGSRGWKGWEK